MNQSSTFWGASFSPTSDDKSYATSTFSMCTEFEAAKEAARRGAKLLVTPEDGLTGFRKQRAAWLRRCSNLYVVQDFPGGSLSFFGFVSFFHDLIELKSLGKPYVWESC